jgi:hypothetical protein
MCGAVLDSCDELPYASAFFKNFSVLSHAVVADARSAQLPTLPSVFVKPPRIAVSPVSMECELMQIVALGQGSGLVLGRVLAMHVRDDVVADSLKHEIDTPRLKLIGRMHGTGWYARTSDLFQMLRIPRASWNLRAGEASSSEYESRIVPRNRS